MMTIAISDLATNGVNDMIFFMFCLAFLPNTDPKCSIYPQYFSKIYTLNCTENWVIESLPTISNPLPHQSAIFLLFAPLY